MIWKFLIEKKYSSRNKWNKLLNSKINKKINFFKPESKYWKNLKILT